MTYDEQWPDAPHLSMTDDGMLKGQEWRKCWNCENQTQWIEINFEAPLCSPECVIDKEIEYWRAVSGESGPAEALPQ